MSTGRVGDAPRPADRNNDSDKMGRAGLAKGIAARVGEGIGLLERVGAAGVRGRWVPAAFLGGKC